MKQRKGLLIGLIIGIVVLLAIVIGLMVSASRSDSQTLPDSVFDSSDQSRTISLQAVQKIALDKVQGTLGESEMEFEDGRMVYSVIVANEKSESEVKIDAQTGQIIEVEVKAIQSAEPMAASVPQTQTSASQKKTGPVSEAEAKEIALERVPGFVTDVEVERKFGRQTIVVEIKPNSGPETDVIIEQATGKILGVET